MAAPNFWSDDRRKFIYSVMPRKKILFANVNGNYKAEWDENANCENFDLIVGYSKDHSIYFICRSEFHIGRKSTDFSSLSHLFKYRRKINVGYKKAPNDFSKQEPVLDVPEGEIDDVKRNLSYYLDKISKLKYRYEIKKA